MVGFIIGIVIGIFIGLFVMGLLVVSRDGDLSVVETRSINN